jgi:hypothetical protein
MHSSEFQQIMIQLSGERAHNRYHLEVNTAVVKVTHSALRTLVRLVIARGVTGTGFLSAPPATVHRLRQAVDRVSQRPASSSLIETGCRQEYRLAIPREELGQRVVLRPDFFELEDLGVLTKDQGLQLRQFCHVLKSC